MDIIEAINKRKSVRDFKNDRVQQTVIREILEIACCAPSAMNTQPWKFTIITKDVLNSVINSVIEKFRSGEKPIRNILLQDGHWIVFTVTARSNLPSILSILWILKEKILISVLNGWRGDCVFLMLLPR
jgi:nitroreductase